MSLRKRPDLSSLLAISSLFAPLCSYSQVGTASGSADTHSEADQQAQAGQEGGLQEIVITAEKRTTSLQTTPLSVTALNAEALQSEQVRSISDIVGLVPGLKIGQDVGETLIYIRGIGSTGFTPGGDSSVAMNVDGVFVSRPIARSTDFYDVSQVEVLRGPQGTLYGRNSSAGSINVATTLPTNEFSGYANARVGNFNDVEFEGAIGGPVIPDRLLVRVAAFAENRGGYGTNVVTGSPINNYIAQGVRATVIFSPFEDFKATVIAERYNEKDNNGVNSYFGPAGLSGLKGALGSPPVFILLGGYAAANPWDVAEAQDTHFALDTTAFTGTLEWRHDALTLRSITGYRGQDYSGYVPLDGGSALGGVFIVGEPDYQFSEELQAHYDTDKFHGTLGAYYFSEKDNYTPPTIALSGALLNLFYPLPTPRPDDTLYRFADVGGLFTTEAKAVFAQATYNILDPLAVIGGIRYSFEHKDLYQLYGISIDQPYSGSVEPQPVEQPPQTFKSTTPKAGLQYQIDRNKMIYLTYSKGFKAGGFDPGVYPATVFQPETLSAYELGLKSEWLDHRLRTNVDGFLYNYNNLQVQQVVNESITTQNAATARVYGMEAEITAVPISALTIDIGLTFLHARYLQYFGPSGALPLLPGNVDFSGRALDNSPDFTAHVLTEYTWQVPRGSLSLRGEGEFSTAYYFTPDNLIDLLGQKSYAKGNAFLTYNDSTGWHAETYVRNISNAAVRTSASVSSPLLGNPVTGTYAPPRTFGVEVGYKF